MTIADRTPWNKGRKLPADILTPDEVRALLSVYSRRAPTGVSNRALIALLYRGQLRIGEALALKPKDLDRQSGTVRVLHGKGNEARTVGLDDGAMVVIELWLSKRAVLGLTGRQPLLCTLGGKPLKASYCRGLFARLAKKAEIEKRVHPHGLRHTGAAELRAEGQDIGLISKQLGHSSIATTARYLDHIQPAAVIEAMRKRVWHV